MYLGLDDDIYKRVDLTCTHYNVQLAQPGPALHRFLSVASRRD